MTAVDEPSDARLEGRPRSVAHRLAAARQRARLIFRLQAALVWVIVITFIVGGLYLGGRLEPDWIADNAPYILGGIWITVVVSISSIALAVVLALLGALGRISTSPIWYGLASLYVSLVRGTPLLVQIFIIFFALPQVGIVLPADPVRDHRPGIQLRRLHDRDLPRRHPGRAAGPARGGAGAGHAGAARLPSDRAATGHAHRDAGDRQRVHRHDQGQLTGLDHHGPGAAVAGAGPSARATHARSRPSWSRRLSTGS